MYSLTFLFTSYQKRQQTGGIAMRCHEKKTIRIKKNVTPFPKKRIEPRNTRKEKQAASSKLLILLPLQIFHHIPIRTSRVRLDLGDLGGGRAPVGEGANAELGHADAKELQKPRLAGIEDIALAADDVAALLLVGGVVGGVLEDDAALDHARGDAEAAQLGLDGVAHGHVVLGGDLAGGGHDGTPRDDEGPRRRDAGAREVHLAEGAEVRQERGRVAVREE